MLRVREVMNTDLVTIHLLITIGHAARKIYKQDRAPPRGGRESRAIITPEKELVSIRRESQVFTTYFKERRQTT
jgi:hypothetical protein